MVSALIFYRETGRWSFQTVPEESQWMISAPEPFVYWSKRAQLHTSWISVAKTSAKTRPLKLSQPLQQIRHPCALSKSCSWFTLRREETPGREGPSPEPSLACVAPSLLQSLNYLLVSRASHTPWCQGRFQIARALLGWPAGLGPAGSGSEGFPCTPLPSHVTALGCWGWWNCSGGSPSVLLCWHSTMGSISFFVVLPGYLQRAFDQHLSGLQQKPHLPEHRHRCNLFKTCL